MKGRHCEERSDVAIHAVQSHGLPRFARNDGFQSHGSPRPDGLAMTDGCGVAMTEGCGLAGKKGRHCEERSDAAIHAVRSPGLSRNACNDGLRSHGSPRPNGLAMTEGCGVAMTEGCGLAGKKGRHCEERSDAAIHAVRSPGLPRNACNDGFRSHGLPRNACNDGFQSLGVVYA